MGKHVSLSNFSQQAQLILSPLSKALAFPFSRKNPLFNFIRAARTHTRRFARKDPGNVSMTGLTTLVLPFVLNAEAAKLDIPMPDSFILIQMSLLFPSMMAIIGAAKITENSERHKMLRDKWSQGYRAALRDQKSKLAPLQGPTA